MGHDLAAQFADFLFVVVGTCLLGMAVDVFRAIRSGLKLSGLAGHLLDGMMWAVCTAGYFGWLYMGTGLALRLYVAVAAVCGGLLYLRLGSGIVYLAVLFVVRLVSGFFRLLFRPFAFLSTLTQREKS